MGSALRWEGQDVPALPSHDRGPVPSPHHPQLFEILAKTPYGDDKKGLFGIEQLLSQGAFRAAFPLHEVRPGGWRGCGGVSDSGMG